MECGFNLHDTMIYEKAGNLTAGSLLSYRNLWEFMLVFSKGTPATINLLKDKPNTWAGNKTGRKGLRKSDGTQKIKEIKPVQEFGIRSNVWRYHTGNNGDDQTGHPAVFPESLARDHILSWSNAGDVVLDPMAGSGTTLKMAMELGRQYIGIEISAEYCEIIRKRLAGANVPLFTI
jgi:site-specific DNA-methyltransferase (adenine-specific)